MKLIIDIPDEEYKNIKDNPSIWSRYFQRIVANGIPYNPSGDAISRRVIKNLLGDKSIPIKFEKEKRGDWHRSLGMTLGDIYTVIDNCPNCGADMKGETNDKCE